MTSSQFPKITHLLKLAACSDVLHVTRTLYHTITYGMSFSQNKTYMEIPHTTIIKERIEH